MAEEHDIFAVIASRRTCKHYSPRPVEMDKILQALQAASLAPSSGNLQNWQFIVVTDTESIRALYHHTLDQEPFLSAPAAIIVCGDVEQAHTLYGVRGKRLYTAQNCAVATQNFLLASHALGMATTWVGAFDEDKVAAMFGIPDRARPQAIVLVGYADGEIEEKGRKPLEAMVFFNRFGSKVLRPHLIYYDWATEWRNQAKKIKEHAAHIAHKLPGRHTEGEQEQQPAHPPVHARMRTSFEAASERMRSVIDQLKREEYQEKKK